MNKKGNLTLAGGKGLLRFKENTFSILGLFAQIIGRCNCSSLAVNHNGGPIISHASCPLVALDAFVLVLPQKVFFL